MRKGTQAEYSEPSNGTGSLNLRVDIILILIILFFACSGKTEVNEGGSSEELMENEIWNPFIILSR